MRRLWITLLISITFPLGANEISIATLPDYAPYAFTETGISQSEEKLSPGQDSKHLKGYSWDQVREVFHFMQYDIKLIVANWARTQKLFESGQVDALFPTSKSMIRKRSMTFSSNALNEVRYVLYLPAQSELEWQSLRQFSGKTIAAIRGFNYGYQWQRQRGINKLDVGSINQGFLLLDKNRVSAFAGYQAVWDHFLQKKQLTERYKRLPPFETSREYLSILKTHPSAWQIIKDFDSGYTRLLRSGKIASIRQKWNVAD